MRNSEKAAEAWSQIKSLDKLLFQPILKYSRKAGDLPMVMELIEKYKIGNFPVQGLGLIYSTGIDITSEYILISFMYMYHLQSSIMLHFYIKSNLHLFGFLIFAVLS